VQRLGRIEADEMERVFNMGVGIVLVVSSDAAASV
jgi:phosphoribosylaminoimidazole (AIR) synthetase